MEDRETSSFKPRVDIRALLSRMETDMEMWAKGYEEISQPLLNQLLPVLQKVLTLVDDTDDIREKLQEIIRKLEHVQSALLHSEPVDRQRAQNLAQQAIEDIREIRHARTSVLRPIEVEDVVGADVIYFYYSLSIVGQVVRFRPAIPNKRAFGFIGDVVFRLCDEQQMMKDLFQDIYPLRDSPRSDLYHWPADLPPQTFQEPGRPKDLLTIQWARHQENDNDEDGEEHTSRSITTIVQEMGTYLKGVRVRKTIREGDGDRRIGMPIYSLIQEQGGYLKGIQIHEDGSEGWIAIGDDGKKMSDESSLFWLETSEYHHLFPTRVLSWDDLYQKIVEALQLSGEKIEKAERDDHDEIIHLQRRLDSIQKFLSGDMEDDETKGRIATVYHNMLWSSVSLNKAEQREEVARQAATEIDQLRQIQKE